MLTLLQRLAITGKHREDWYRAMGKTAEDGLPQLEVLKSLDKDFHKTKHPMAPLVRELALRLAGKVRPGAPAHRTVGTELQGLVPEVEATLIQAGIQSGHIPEGFFNAADFVASQGKLRNAVMASMGKPLFYLTGLASLLIFFSIRVLPAFEKGTPRVAWPESAQLLGAIADHVYWIVGGSVGLVGGLACLVLFLSPRWTGDRRDWFDRHIFPFTLIAQLNGASFLKSIACYIGAGFPVLEAIKQIGRGSSPYMAYQCTRIHHMAAGGRRFEEGLLELPIVQPRYHWLINVYGLASDAAAAYTSIANEMTEMTLGFVKNVFDRVISNAILLLVGAMLAWIYLSMFAIADASSKRRTAVLEPEIIRSASVSSVPWSA